MTGIATEARRLAGPRVVATWCGVHMGNNYSAVLLALDDGYYASCRRWDHDKRRYVEFWGYFRERGEFHLQDEADRWAADYFELPVRQAFPSPVARCDPAMLFVH